MTQAPAERLVTRAFVALAAAVSLAGSAALFLRRSSLGRPVVA